MDMNARTNFMLGIPVGLKLELEKAAKAKDTSPSAFARKAMADAVGYALPAGSTSRVKKYATEEERKAAQKVKNTERRDLINALLAAHRKAEEGATPS